MKKILLGTAVTLLLLTGCTEEKKTTETQATQEVKKDEVTTTPAQTPAVEVKKEETK
jgi:PBP1b-binding outer membrane lipoprotein LpoB